MQGVPEKAIFRSLKVYTKILSSQCNLLAQIEEVQNKKYISSFCLCQFNTWIMEWILNQCQDKYKGQGWIWVLCLVWFQSYASISYGHIPPLFYFKLSNIQFRIRKNKIWYFSIIYCVIYNITELSMLEIISFFSF